jgi:uncharacterized protein (DUF1499 family)
MKVLVFISVAVVALAAALVLFGQLGWFAGQTPSGIGVHNGRLKPPSFTPNSVSSQADLYPDHPQHAYARIAALPFDGNADAALLRLAGAIQNTDRCTIVTQQPDYLYAQCSTPMLRFTDDVEFWLDRPARVFQLRSASRLGHSDLGANRARMEKIRAQFLSQN